MKKTIFSGLFSRVFVIFSFLFFTQNLYSQKFTITGLDNVHISEGATIIEKKSNKDIIAITSNGTQKIINSEKNNSDKKELIAKGKNTLKNKIAKTSIKKIIKTKKISNPIIFLALDQKILFFKHICYCKSKKMWVTFRRSR